MYVVTEFPPNHGKSPGKEPRMKRFLPATGSLMFLCVLIGAASGQLASTHWPMFSHDIQHTAVSAFNGPAVPGIFWSYRAGGTVFTGVTSSPTLGSDDKIYVGFLDNSMYCLTSTGSLVWSYLTGDSIFSSAALGTDGRIFVGSEDNSFYALTSVGALNWSYTTAEELRSSPVLSADGTIYFGSGDNKVYAATASGALHWSYTTGWFIDSSPAIAANGAIHIGSGDQNVYSLMPAGTLNWSYRTGSVIETSPSIAADGTIYTGAVDNAVYALTSIGSLNWSFATRDEIFSSPAVGTDGTIYIGSDDTNVYSFTPQGALRWTYTTGSWVEGNPVVGANGRIYVGSLDTNLYSLNGNGTLNWTFNTGAYIFGSAVVGPKERIFVGTTVEFGSEGCQLLSISKKQPLLNVILSNDTPAVGDFFTIDLNCAPVSGAFDAYGGVIMPNGQFESFVLGKPTQLVKGVKALATKEKGLRTPFSTRLFLTPITPGSAGVYTVIVALVPEGVKPTIPNAIPDYIDQEVVVVH